ncbi:BnaC04g42670D [Brassica napus]|uniref:BnaC04g42670D protein n=1 Tax=Brassica napus TaxID=3708 RepID=A0A078FQ99_BRANA|nr:BnaC04g42670D [Brassica napus]
MVGVNEIVLTPWYKSVPPYVIYFNVERKTITKVGIRGMEAFRGSNNMNFSDEEEGENLKTVKDGIRSGSDNDQDERIYFEEQNDSCSSNDDGTEMEFCLNALYIYYSLSTNSMVYILLVTNCATCR